MSGVIWYLIVLSASGDPLLMGNPPRYDAQANCVSGINEWPFADLEKAGKIANAYCTDKIGHTQWMIKDSVRQ